MTRSMSIVRRRLAVIAAVAALTLSGCVGGVDTPAVVPGDDATPTLVPSSEPSPGPTLDGDAGGDVGSDAGGGVDQPMVEPVDQFAAVVAEVLTPSLGEVPVVDCGSADIEIAIGNDVLCSYATSSHEADILVTIISVDDVSYSVEIDEQ